LASHQNGRIKSRPNSQRNLGSTTTGLRETGLETERDGLLYVPESFNPKAPSPLIVMLHGEGETARQGISPLREFADRTGTILLAAQSQGPTWDASKSGLGGGAGVDVYFIDEALSDVFALYSIDPKRIAIAGFSEGAAYAFTLAITNSDLFTHVIAFSPSQPKQDELRDLPPVFISHGTSDTVSPIAESSRTLVPKLKAIGLEVTYQEFDGAHTIPADVSRRAFTWFLGIKALAEARGGTVRRSEVGVELT
jgi:phospholipase/carboxylesterase